MGDLAAEILADPNFDADEPRIPGPDAGPGGGGGVVPYILFRDAQPLMASGWLVKGLLPARGLAAVYGPSGCGKTFVALDMLLHIAAGMPWRGMRTKRTGVLYLSPDGGRAVQNRLAAWRQHHGVTEADFALAPGSVDLLGKIAAGDVEAVLAAISEIEAAHDFKIGVVAVDTVSRAMPGGDENRPEDMTGFITNVARLHNDGERLGLVIHHTPKSDATVLRGHSSLHGACDCELNVADRAIRVAKQRDGAADAVHGFDLKVIGLGHDEDGDAVTSCVAVAADAPEGRKKPLSPNQKIFISTLQNFVAKHGERLPEGPDYPSRKGEPGHYLGGSLSRFRQEYFARHEAGTDRDTTKKAYNRSLRELQTIGEIGVYGDWIWCRDKRDKAGQA